MRRNAYFSTVLETNTHVIGKWSDRPDFQLMRKWRGDRLVTVAHMGEDWRSA